jgi:hypothetical protein
MFDFSEPVGFTIFCDDIREEMGGKTSFIGTYDAVMVIHAAFPTVLPKFGFHIRIYEPANLVTQRDIPIEISIYLPGDAEHEPSLFQVLPADPQAARIELANLPWHPKGERPLLARTTLNWIAAPLVLKEPGAIRVLANYKGDSLRCGTLQVIPATAVAPVSNPNEQSAC